MLEPQNISKLSSRWRVLPLDHLGQAIWIRFDPLDTMTPSCRTQQQCRQQQWTCHTVPCGCINWINIFKFWTLFECLETQTQAHFLEMLTTLCMLEKKKKSGRSHTSRQVRRLAFGCLFSFLFSSTGTDAKEQSEQDPAKHHFLSFERTAMTGRLLD